MTIEMSDINSGCHRRFLDVLQCVYSISANSQDRTAEIINS